MEPTVYVEPEPTPVPTEIPPEPTAIPVVPTEEVVSPIDTPEEAEEAPGQELVESAAPEPDGGIDAPAQTLSIAADNQPTCVLAPGFTDTVAHGNAVEYACTHTIQATGGGLDPAAVVLDWEVNAGSDGGWMVQVLPPPDETHPAPDWSSPDQPAATFAVQQPLEPAADVAAAVSFSEQRSISFGVRVHRPSCALPKQGVDVWVSATASTPGSTEADISDLTSQYLPAVLQPLLEPIPEPSVEFASALDFGTVGISAAGPEESVMDGTIAISVSGLDQACGTWNLNLKANRLEGGDDSTISAANLSLESVDGVAVAVGGCSLDDGCVVAVVQAGPSGPTSQTITLGVSLRLPDLASATTFNSTLTATLNADDA